jgi:hypothetical protein
MPTGEPLSLSERMQSSYKQLSEAAVTLNAASDDLGKAVNALDDALKRLNLGITAWFNFLEGGSDDGFYYTYTQIGYAKVGSKWGLAIRTVSGNQAEDDDTVHDIWLFNDAPRDLRVSAVASIPDLLDQLREQARITTERTVKKATQARQLAAAIAPETAAARRK